MYPIHLRSLNPTRFQFSGGLNNKRSWWLLLKHLYLSMSLSRSPLRSGRRQVQTSSVTISAFSVIRLITSAVTYIIHQRQWLEYKCTVLLQNACHIHYRKEKHAAYSMISHLLRCTKGTFNIMPLPVIMDHLTTIQKCPTQKPLPSQHICSKNYYKGFILLWNLCGL